MELKNGTPALIKVQTEIEQEGERKEFLFSVDGQMVRMGSSLYLRYKEPEMEENPSGKEETYVTVKIEADGRVQIIRSGTQRMRLYFNDSHAHDVRYQTAYGDFPITVVTHDLRISLRDQPFSGEVNVKYDLTHRETQLGKYQLHLEFMT